MITIFNRREVLLTREAAAYDDARSRLQAAGIAYQTRCRDMLRGRGGRNSRSNFGLNQEFLYEYTIYVHREDVERAKHILQR